MAMAQKQNYRTKVQDGKPIDKPTWLWSLKPCKWTRMYKGEKPDSSISGAEKSGQLHVKEWN